MVLRTLSIHYPAGAIGSLALRLGLLWEWFTLGCVVSMDRLWPYIDRIPFVSLAQKLLLLRSQAGKVEFDFCAILACLFFSVGLLSYSLQSQ
jgi:hypothetical protein